MSQPVAGTDRLTRESADIDIDDLHAVLIDAHDSLEAWTVCNVTDWQRETLEKITSDILDFLIRCGGEL